MDIKFLWFILLLKLTRTLAIKNYTLCTNDAGNYLFQIDWANASFNTFNFQLSFDIFGITNINKNQSYYFAEKTQIEVGISNKHKFNWINQFCKNDNKCPTITTMISNNWTLFQKTLQLQEFHLPLADINTQYSTWIVTDNNQISQQMICLQLAPIGYQDPFWAHLFTYLPISIGLFILLITFFSIYATTPIMVEDNNRIFVLNYLPTAIQLRLPDISEVIYYAQFIFTMGLLNLSYPKFYPLFSSNFAWSFLLFPIRWIIKDNNTLSEASQYPEDDDSTVYFDTGILNMTNRIDLDMNYLFVTVLVYFLLLVVTLLLLKSMFKSLFSSQYVGIKRRRKVMPFALFLNHVLSTMLQCMTLFYLPLTLTGLYQLMLSAPWYILLSAAIVIVFLSSLLYAWIGFIMLRLNGGDTILIQPSTFERTNSLYFMFTERQRKFFLYTILHKLVLSLIVGLFQRNGTAQLIVIIVIETIYFGLQLFKCPYATNQINIFYITIGFFRLSHVLLNIVYLPSLQLSEHDKQVVAYVQICFHMLCFILLFSFTLKNLFNILLGTLDNQFKGQNPVPAVRMLRWRRYKRNNKSKNPSHQYQLHPAQEYLPNENHLMIVQNEGIENNKLSFIAMPSLKGINSNEENNQSKIIHDRQQPYTSLLSSIQKDDIIEGPSRYYLSDSTQTSVLHHTPPPIPPPHIELPNKIRHHQQQQQVVVVREMVNDNHMQ